MTDLRRHVPPIALVWDEEVPGALSRVVDGTLVFADVSGFTALTERLSRRGRIGAGGSAARRSFPCLPTCALIL